jgi:protein TonB
MTNKEILQASLLDIIFENRNKSYGAYALRNEYDKRLIKSLGIGLGIVLTVVLLNFLKSSAVANDPFPQPNDGYVVSVVEMEQEKQPEPEKEKPVEKKAAQIDFQTLKIVDDNKVTQKLADNSDANDKVISNINTSGPPDINPFVATPGESGDGVGKKADPQPEETTPPVKIYQRDPQFPGGFEALSEFLRKNLSSPEELEVGEKRIVKVRFIVGRDGTITDITVLESPGREFDKEVSRVVRRMPKWEPAIQNDITVAVGYVLPVTFMGVEE